MKIFELKLMEEHVRTERHVRNLTNFLQDKERIENISKAEQALLRRQVAAMAALNDVLKQRLKLHNIPI